MGKINVHDLNLFARTDQCVDERCDLSWMVLG